MEQHHHEPQPLATPVLSEVEGLPTIRHDGWTGEKMAAFCETLAETAVVAEACDQAGMSPSGAYAARRRNPAGTRGNGHTPRATAAACAAPARSAVVRR